MSEPGAVSDHTIRPGFVLRWRDGAAPAPAAGTQLALHFTVGDRAAGVMFAAPPATEPPAGSGNTPGVFHAAIGLSAAMLEHLLADAPDGARVRSVLAGTGGPGPLLPLTPSARLALDSIRHCPFAGAFRALALTARANDLVVEFLGALAAACAPHTVAPNRFLTTRVAAAAAVLAADLAHPPSLAELARRVGLGETTLKRSFRQVHGTTVFGYLRARRLEHARDLLARGEATVLEAAALVGYSNPSNFAAAFRREFGLNPKEFQLAARRR